MSRPRLLLTAGGGFLGAYLLENLAPVFEVHAGSRSGATHLKLDLEDPSSIAKAAKLAPRYVVHNAALTLPDVCEADPEAAHRTNVDGTRALVEAVRDSCERFIYCSTDLVYGGDRAYTTETDSPSPLMVYGRSKLEGEIAARAVLEGRVVVARTALLYGWGRGRAKQRSFAERTLFEARNERPVRLFTDQYRSPLYIEDAVRGIASLLEWSDAPPVVHLGEPERLSRYDMGVQTLEVFDLDPALAVPVPMTAVPSPAPRPGDVSLSIELARSRGFHPRSFRDGLRAMRDGQERE